MFEGHLAYLFISRIDYRDNSKTIYYEPVLVLGYVSLGHYHIISNGEMKTVKTTNILTEEELDLESKKGTKVCAKNLNELCRII
jgi:hypothetical protein